MTAQPDETAVITALDTGGNTDIAAPDTENAGGNTDNGPDEVDFSGVGVKIGPAYSYRELKQIAIEHQEAQDALLAEDMSDEVKEELQAAIDPELVELACEFEEEFRARREASKAAASLQAITRGKVARSAASAGPAPDVAQAG